MKSIQKTMLSLLCFASLQSALLGQAVSGKLTLNGKSKIVLELETNSTTSLFKDFKTKKYKIQLQLEADQVPKNAYGETLVFIDFITQVKKDGKLITELKRELPFNYFPGDMYLAPESFDFIPILSGIDGNNTKDPKNYGTIPEGKYTIVLRAIPKGFKGAIDPLEIYFALRRRPTR